MTLKWDSQDEAEGIRVGDKTDADGDERSREDCLFGSELVGRDRRIQIRMQKKMTIKMEISSNDQDFFADLDLGKCEDKR